MALILGDRVKETTTVTGAGTATLLGATTGFQSFAAVGDGNTTYYCIADQTGANWEVGIGTYTSAGTTISRTTVLSSSNANALVVFTAGVKDVFVTYPSEKGVWYDTSGSVLFTGTTTATNLAYTGTLTGTTGVLNIGSGQLYKDSSGNVGIGTSSPTGKLVVVSGDDNTDTSFAKQQLTVVGANQTLVSGLGNLQIVTNSAFSADFGGSLSFGGRYATSDARSVMWAGIKGAKENNTNGSLLGYLAFSTSLVERMRIDSSGNVGIGGLGPISASRVITGLSETITGVNLTIGYPNNGGSLTLNDRNGGVAALINENSGLVIARAGGAFGGNNNIIFATQATNSTLTPLESMRIDSSGNVGIGTTSPTGKLDVAGTIKTLGYTVATLPTGVVGARAYVTNALAPTFGATVVTGGAVTIPVFYNGTNWIVG